MSHGLKLRTETKTHIMGERKWNWQKETETNPYMVYTETETNPNVVWSKQELPVQVGLFNQVVICYSYLQHQRETS